MENSRSKQLVSFTSHAVLSSVVKCVLPSSISPGTWIPALPSASVGTVDTRCPSCRGYQIKCRDIARLCPGDPCFTYWRPRRARVVTLAFRYARRSCELFPFRESACISRETHSIYRVRHHPQFQDSTGGLGTTYPLHIRGNYCSLMLKLAFSLSTCVPFEGFP